MAAAALPDILFNCFFVFERKEEKDSGPSENIHSS
jgi:hypothetical protein